MADPSISRQMRSQTQLQQTASLHSTASPPSSPILSTLSEVSPVDAQVADEEPNWWFTGRHAEHDAHFIDLFGNKTDHYADVRQYLILIGSNAETPMESDAVGPKEEKAKLDQDEMAMEKGKALLREAWKEGQGYFLVQDLEGRDYSKKDGSPPFGVPWFDDMRDSGCGHHTSPRAGGPHPLKGTSFDVGNHDDQYPEVGSKTKPFIGPHRKALTSDNLIKTNLRCPLPLWECCLAKPNGNRAQWAKLVRVLYTHQGHPAFDAIAATSRVSDVDINAYRHQELAGQGFLTSNWAHRFPEVFGLDPDLESECIPSDEGEEEYEYEYIPSDEGEEEYEYEDERMGVNEETKPKDGNGTTQTLELTGNGHPGQ